MSEHGAVGAIRHLKQSEFLKVFSEWGVVQYAADQAGINRQTHYNWLKSDPEYAKAFADAEEAAIDRLEAEATRRAVKGVEEPAGWYKGEPGGMVTKYSDVLLIFLLKARRPGRFRDKYQNTPDETPDDFAEKTMEALEQMQATVGGDTE